ncbi:MAG: hypothetical protein J6S84_08165 [Bacteroidales bacterium]|nr:hypothetical protein [Bacteroidales bacterium]
MKKHYHLYNETLPIEADTDDLKELLAQKKQLLENYEEISCDLDNEMYISRGNGFCTTKWAPDVIDDKIDELTKQIAEIEDWLKK